MRTGKHWVPANAADERQRGGRMSPVLEAENLVTGYGAVRVVHGVDLRVEPGEVVALLGPNGAGKTSTIRMVVGLSRPDQAASASSANP
jgi:ABC-type multidrug transport system ATPase subunit